MNGTAVERIFVRKSAKTPPFSAKIAILLPLAPRSLSLSRGRWLSISRKIFVIGFYFFAHFFDGVEGWIVVVPRMGRRGVGNKTEVKSGELFACSLLLAYICMPKPASVTCANPNENENYEGVGDDGGGKTLAARHLYSGWA